jgi:RimJ/RimL family protein N-acetyltransferase
MQIRPIAEEDIQQVIDLFRKNYGDDYPMPEFYDPHWVKRGIYSDHIIWMVIEDEGRIIANGAAILNFGDYNDQIAEIGRLVVDPTVGGKGLGRTMIDALVDASDERVEFAFGEARTTHPKTQKIFDHAGLAPLGFLPMNYRVEWRESWMLSGQLFGNGRRLRRPGAAQIIPEALPIAQLALRNLELDENVTVRADVRAYPLEGDLAIEPLTGNSLVRLLKIEQGRVTEPEVFGGLHIDQGLTALQARKATYLVANEGGQTLGAVGYTFDEGDALGRIIELIARDDAVKGMLLRRAVEQLEEQHEAELIEADVSAYSPRIQRTLADMGFVPAAFVPGMVFHQTGRWDVVRMIKLNVTWDLGPLQFTPSGQAMFDTVSPGFVAADQRRASRLLALGAKALEGLNPLEVEFVQRAGEVLTPAAGAALPADALNIVLAGAVTQGGRTLAHGDSFGGSALLGVPAGDPGTAGEGARLLRLTPHAFAALGERHPRLSLRVYRNIASMAITQ